MRIDPIRPFGLSLFPLTLGLACFAASLTPSLLPRSWLVQGVLGGVVLALGYLTGSMIMSAWRQMAMPMLRGRAAGWAHALLLGLVLGALVVALVHALDWQNDIRTRMGLPLADAGHEVRVVLLAALVGLALLLVGFAVQFGFDWVRHRLYRHMPRRRSNAIGLLITVLALFFLTRDGVVDRVYRMLDQVYFTAQDLFDTAPPAPDSPLVPGGPGSAVDWAAMGQPGRDFVTGGPDAAAISAFTGRPALDPVRVYVGLAQLDEPEDRAELALAELIRLGGFDRKVLVVTMPTGTGWMDPGSHDVLEYMHGGDVATVAVQYSYLQSPMALIFETDAGLSQARSLISTIHRYWRDLPPDARPRLYMHGLSLGAWASMYGTDLFALLDDPVHGALWAGPPFPSGLWNEAMARRNPGSRYVAPDVADGRLIRFASHTRDAGGTGGWGSMRLVFLQYASDPITFYEPTSVWRAPQWMREPPAPDVSPALRFIPLVTQAQLVVDMLLANTAPPGHGHSYYPRDYVSPWQAVTAPEGWTDADSARLIAMCSAGENKGLKRGCPDPAAS